MLKNYFRVAWRTIRKNKVFSAINIVGFAVGISACIIIMLFVFYEKSFDDFHTKNIYRLNEVQKFPGMLESQKVALSMFPMGPTLKQEFPEIRNFTRVRWNEKYLATYGEQRVYLPRVLDVDSTFLSMFDFNLIRGDRRTALMKPNSVLITESTARKLFGKADPIGKTITHLGGDTTRFSVTGILADVPLNSQMQFDALTSFSTFFRPQWNNNWGGNWLNTYLELAPNTDMAALEKKFPDYLKKHLQGDTWKFYQLFLLPYRDVHAASADIGLDYLNYQKFDGKVTNLFALIALIVLVIACFNFVNLSTARSSERAREVGVRKAIGAKRMQLAGQFLGETLLLSLIALVLAALLTAYAIPYINDLSQRNIGLPLYTEPAAIPVIILATLFVGLLSGIYPAVFLSAFRPVKVLKGNADGGRNKSILRNVLVVGQFSSAIFLMVATVFVLRQLKFMQSKDPGFVRDQVVTIPLDNSSGRNYEVLKQTFLKSAHVSAVTASIDYLGGNLDQTGIEFRLGNGPIRNLGTTMLVVDPDYLNLYRIKVLAGSNFTDRQSTGREYIINEAMAKELLKEHPGKGFSALIGAHLGMDSVGTITGVVKDFNFNSLHYKVETLFLVNKKDWGFRNMSVKINGGKTDAAMADIQAAWKKLNPDVPFEYQFVDDRFNDVYRADNQVSRIVGILAGLAIFISCLGLFGLASYSAERRIKEIGVRKILGASVRNVVVLLSGNFLRLVLFANALALPVAWLAMDTWLQRFAYRIDIHWWVFALAGGAALLIAFVTVSVQAIKAALANPVKTLRSE